MTVKELKEALAEFPDDKEVCVEKEATEDYDGGIFVVEDLFLDEEANAVIVVS